MLEIDFKKDWKNHIETELKSLGLPLKTSKSLDIDTVRYFNIKRRLLSQKIRNIHESQELYIPSKYSAGYCELKKCFSEGRDLTPYLSRRTTGRRKSADYRDLLLNEWGITHFHFSPAGTKDVIFAMVTNTDVFIIQVFPHGHGDPYTWVNTELIEILHNNWPEIIVDCKTHISGEQLTKEQRKNIREKQRLNTIITVSDGTNYLPPGGGFVMCGDCIFDIKETDELMNKLTVLEDWVRTTESNIRAALNLAKDEKLFIKIGFNGQQCYLYEPDKNIKLNITFTEDYK